MLVPCNDMHRHGYITPQTWGDLNWPGKTIQVITLYGLSRQIMLYCAVSNSFVCHSLIFEWKRCIKWLPKLIKWDHLAGWVGNLGHPQVWDSNLGHWQVCVGNLGHWQIWDSNLGHWQVSVGNLGHWQLWDSNLGHWQVCVGNLGHRKSGLVI